MSAVITVNDVCLWYGKTQALKNIDVQIPEKSITALIGPSGCGKSTFLKTLNRMNDLIPEVRITGEVLYQERNIFEKSVDVNDLRKNIGMVFQKPNPFPMSVYDNIAYGPRTHGMVDSNEGENELAPFRNVMNELYARDISRKVRSAHRIRGNSGEPLSQPPYGYMKAPENRKKWIIDPEAAKVVQEIFRMALEGKGNETIARILQERKILNCTAYWQSKGIGRGGKKTQPNPYKWGKTAVEKILARQEYCGDVINFKTYSKSFKNKARLESAPKNWVIFKNVHEPIIDRETFEQVQKLTGNTKRRAPKQENSGKNLFCDLLYCADCDRKLWYHTNTVNKDIHYFSCSNYAKDYRGSCPTRHYIRADAVEQVVIAELRLLADCFRYDQDRFAALLEQKTDSDRMKEQRLTESELQKAVSRSEKVSQLYEKVYEDNAEGKISDEWFMQLSHKY